MFTTKKIIILNYLVALLPLSIILGNLAINITIILISVVGLIIYKYEIFNLKNKKYLLLLYIFFSYLILVTLVNNIPYLELDPRYKENLLKSIFFLRFLLLFQIINKLIDDNNFNIKLFFISCSFFAFLLSIDIIIQVIFGKDLINNTITGHRPSGFFGEEHIAGSYLQKFSLFFIFLISLMIKKKKFIIIILTYIFFLVPIILTANRMPALIFILSSILFLILQKKFKEILICSFIISFIFFLIIFNPPSNSEIDKQIRQFYYDSVNIISKAPRLFIFNSYKGEKLNFSNGNMGYLLHFNSGVQIWKENKFFGKGIKSMPLNCKFKDNQTCNTHPHNYFIEILLSTGIFGLILIYSFFLISLKKFLKFYFSVKNQKLRLILVPFFLIIFFEFFPFRSSGSFFTTNNSVIIFLILAIFVNVEKLKKFKLNYKI